MYTVTLFVVKKLCKPRSAAFVSSVSALAFLLLLSRMPTNSRISKVNELQSFRRQDTSNGSRFLDRTLTTEECFDSEHRLSPFSSHEQLNKERIDYMYKMCNLKSASLVPFNRFHITYFQSRMYNFSYCLVPKAGCSFWMQVLNILEHLGNPSEIFFNTSRRSLHQGETVDFLYINPTRVTKEAWPAIITSRDPYSRLFSVYIDKIYVPNMWFVAASLGHSRKIGPKNCGSDVTFEEFLRAIIVTAYRGQLIDKHWTPISLLCRPCDVNTSVIVKQESFAEDVLFALQKFGVDNQTMETIKDALHIQRVEATIPGIVNTIYANTNYTRVRRCFGTYGLAKRIWRSFVVQGFIDEKQHFPSFADVNIELLRYPNYLIQLLLNTIRRHPMAEGHSRKQRRNFLVNAYKAVSKWTIENIKRLYKDDFLMFNYTFDAPSG